MGQELRQANRAGVGPSDSEAILAQSPAIPGQRHEILRCHSPALLAFAAHQRCVKDVKRNVLTSVLPQIRLHTDQGHQSFFLNAEHQLRLLQHSFILRQKLPPSLQRFGRNDVRYELVPVDLVRRNLLLGIHAQMTITEKSLRFRSGEARLSKLIDNVDEAAVKRRMEEQKYRQDWCSHRTVFYSFCPKSAGRMLLLDLMRKKREISGCRRAILLVVNLREWMRTGAHPSFRMFWFARGNSQVSQTGLHELC